MKIRQPVFPLALFLCGLSPAASAQTQITSPSKLKSTDSTLQITAPVGTTYAGPSVTFTTADQLTFSRLSGGYEIDEANVNYGDTAFANGTLLIGAGGFQGPGDGGPVELSFSNPVTEFGLNIEEFNGGAYTVDFTAFDVYDNKIGSYAAMGNDPLTGGTTTLSFEGLASNDPISYIDFNDSGAGGSNNLLFGNIRYAPSGFVGLEGPPAPTPEPGSFLLLGSGLSVLAFCSRRLAHRAPKL